MSSLPVRSALFASLSAVAAFANIAIAVPAHAQDVLPAQAAVRYHDLDLATDTGVTKLDRRLATATGIVCGSVDARNLSALAHNNACRKEAMTKVAPQVAAVIEHARNGTSFALVGGITVAAR